MSQDISCRCGQPDDALRRQNEELSEANRNLEAALLSISHDLRNPLHIIMMGSFYLLEKSGSQPGSRERSCLQRVNSAAQSMVAMIDGLLGMCCIAGKDMSCAAIDASRAVAGIISEFQKDEPSRPVTSIIQEGVQVWGDPRLIQVVLVNLIGNSWKYTADRQPAVIEFGAAARGGSMTCFVRDNGVGFDASLAERLFLPLQRFHDGFEGTGIGLATVQRIVTRLGGRVWAEGEPGKGATFCFTLPAVPSP